MQRPDTRETTRRRPRARALLLGGLAAFVSLASREARADEASSRLAQTMFDEARAKMEAGEIDQACVMLAESQRLDPGGGTLLNLAVCHEKQGRLATAWAEYHDAQSLAVRDDRKDRQALAAERIREIEPRLPRLVVLLPPGHAAGLDVKVDGAPFSSAASGLGIPVDPGSHEVIVSGSLIWSYRVPAIAEGQRVVVTVPEPVPLPAPSPPKPHLGAGTYVAGGTALALFTVSAVTGALALSAQSSANAACNPALQFCSSPDGPSDATRARTLAWASTITLGAGVAATVVAILWPRVKAAPSGAARGFAPRPDGLAWAF